MHFLVASPLCVSALKLEINRHDSFITQSVAILHNVPVSPSLTTSFIHMLESAQPSQQQLNVQIILLSEMQTHCWRSQLHASWWVLGYFLESRHGMGMMT